MTKKTRKLSNQDKWLLAIIALVLVGGVWYIGCGDEGGTTPANETMSTAELMAMMPMTASPYSSCSELNMALLQIYDDNPQNGVIDYDEAIQAISDWYDHLLTDDEVTQVHYAWDNSCPVDQPSSSYWLYGIIAIIIIGGAVLYARRKNIGGK